MNMKLGQRFLSLVLACMMVVGLMPMGVLAAQTGEEQPIEPVGRFVLVVEANGEFVIEPQYIYYGEGQTVKEALKQSGHIFNGIDSGMISSIDGVVVSFTRSDEKGGHNIDVKASTITHFRFTDNLEGSQPSEGLCKLMTAMADYCEEEPDVQNAAFEEYATAKKSFIGVSSANAQMLANDLAATTNAYKSSLEGEKFVVSFSDGSKLYSTTNFPGVKITVENPYGKQWTSDNDNNDGTLELPGGKYKFHIEQDGLHIEGDSLSVSANRTVTAKLPSDKLWLNTDTVRLSGSCGSEEEEGEKFTDAEFTLGEWSGRHLTVEVIDMFKGDVYNYFEHTLEETPSLKSIYIKAGEEEQFEKKLSFKSLYSGTYEVMDVGAAGNTVVYRITKDEKSSGGYTYSQDYTVNFVRTPTLTSLILKDQNGIEQAAEVCFSGDLNEYTYPVLDTTQYIRISAEGREDNYSIAVDGKPIEESDPISLEGVENKTVEVVVTAGEYSNTYTLAIQKGRGQRLTFKLTEEGVTVEVVNKNGVVMPYDTKKEMADNTIRYNYTLVVGQDYSYIATKDGCYNMADTFQLQNIGNDASVGNRTIEVKFDDMSDWLTELAIGAKEGASDKGTLQMTPGFSAEEHFYSTTFVDTDHIPAMWVTCTEEDIKKVEAFYTQVHSQSFYHGETLTRVLKSKDLASGKKKGIKLTNFLMAENPIENTLTVRLTKEKAGVSYYQDYFVEFKRELTLKDITAKCDDITAVLVQNTSKETQGFEPKVREYNVTVPMTAKELELFVSRYKDNLCYFEEEVGYRIKAGEEGTDEIIDATESGLVTIELDGSMATQVVKITVENDKAPEGTGTYIVNVLKSPPVEVTFDITSSEDVPGFEAVLSLYEVMAKERLWPNESGVYELCEGYKYAYTTTEYGHVGKGGVLKITRNDQQELVVQDILVTEDEKGDEIETVIETYEVSETAVGGETTIHWVLTKALDNEEIKPDIEAEWPDFRGNSEDNASGNNAVVKVETPIKAEEGVLYWATKLGEGFGASAVGSPIIVDGDLITYSSNEIFRVDPVNGEIVATGTMDHNSSFSITPPVYAEGMIFVALANGCIQAFNAEPNDQKQLESLWIYNDPMGGQPNSPLTVKNGFLYTGFWYGEELDCNFVCLSITDEDPTRSDETKYITWYYTVRGGYYWAGAYAGDGFVLVGTDDGEDGYISKTSKLLMLDSKTGKLLDSLENLNGDIRSTVVYDSETDAYYFTSKGGTFYSVKVTEGENGKKLTDLRSVSLKNGTRGIPMSTSSPVIYNRRAYIGVSGEGQFNRYHGHNITVIDLSNPDKPKIAYSVTTEGYPQTSGLLTTAYEQETGYVYIYFFDNMIPGKLRLLRDKPGMTEADYLTTEYLDEYIDGELTTVKYTTAYALFTPDEEQMEYAICSPIVDDYGTIYFKNDSAHLMAYGSAIESLTVTKSPDKTSYMVGEKFDPTGMVVMANYKNGKSRDVSKYVSYETGELTEQDKNFTISFKSVMYQNRESGTEMLAGMKAKTPVVTISLDILLGDPGDVNSDGNIDQRDVKIILDYEAKLTEEAPSPVVADVSGDGIIDSNDAVLISQYIDGSISQFPVEQEEGSQETEGDIVS